MIDRFIRYSLITVSGLFLLNCRERGRAAASNERPNDIGADPFCIKDLSSDPEHAAALAELRNELENALRQTGDPRILGTGDIFDTYPRFGRMRPFEGFRKRGEYNRSGPSR